MLSGFFKTGFLLVFTDSFGFCENQLKPNQMKQIIYFLFITLVLNSCKKDDTLGYLSETEPLYTTVTYEVISLEADSAFFKREIILISDYVLVNKDSLTPVFRTIEVTGNFVLKVRMKVLDSQFPRYKNTVPGAIGWTSLDGKFSHPNVKMSTERDMAAWSGTCGTLWRALSETKFLKV